MHGSPAKATDPSMSDDANARIGRISAYMPDKAEGFMKGMKEGASLNVPCWIGETVRLRYKS